MKLPFAILKLLGLIQLSSAGLLYYQQQQPPPPPAGSIAPNPPLQAPPPATAGDTAAPPPPPNDPQLQPPMQPDAASGPAAHAPRSPDRDGIFRYQGLALNSTTVKLVWNLLNGLHADYFDIEWGPITDTQVFAVNKINGSSRDYTFHNLQPETSYQFQLHGYHDHHVYKPQFVLVKTPSANYAPKSHQELINRDIMPLGVKAEPKANNSIQLSWTEADKPANLRNSNKVNIIRYYVNPTNQLAAQNETAPQAPQYHYLNVTNARESRLIVQKLKPGSEYAFAVKTAYYSPDMRKIFTQSGFSMDTLAKTLELEPSAPRNFTVQALQPNKEDTLAGKSSKLELSWSPPEFTNGQLKGYLILYAHKPQSPDDLWERIEVNGPAISNWYVANLSAGWSYYFKIRAINQRGQSPDSETRLYVAPAAPPPDRIVNMPIPANNVLLLIVICMVAILFLLFLVVSRLACRSRRKPRKGSIQTTSGQSQKLILSGSNAGGDSQVKLNGFAQTNSSSTVAARVGTLARRRENASSKPDFWISAMDQQADAKSSISEKSNSELNMAMVSIQRNSPQFATTQLAPALPDYRFASAPTDHHLLQQLHNQNPQQSHYHPGHFAGSLAYDQMDSATANALMTLSKRQQQQLQKYQIQFATTGGVTPPAGPQAPSPHQQPPPPPPLNIEQQQQALYGTNNQQSGLNNTRSLRLNRPTLYDPVSGSFVQSADGGPPNYNAQHHIHPLLTSQQMASSQFQQANSNTLQFHPHQTSTLLSRRSTNTLRSFQTSATGGSVYGQFGANGNSQFAMPPQPNSMNVQQPQQLLQSHQAVINQLNNSTYPSLPLKHVSAVRPQIMSSLEDQIEMELAEKDHQQPSGEQQQQQQQLDQQQSQTIKQ